MHWTNNRIDYSALLLIATVYFQLVFLLWLTGQNSSSLMPFVISVGLPVLVLFLSGWALQLKSGFLYQLIWMCVLGSAGVIIGSIQDFGVLSLILLSNLCNTYSTLSLVSIATKINLAPWTYAGMIAGCIGGMMLSEYKFNNAGKINILKMFKLYILYIPVMFVGMLFVETYLFVLIDEVNSVLAMMALMQASMIISMLFIVGIGSKLSCTSINYLAASKQNILMR